MCKEIQVIESTENKHDISFGANLKPDLYYIIIFGKNSVRTFKIIKL